MDSSINPDRNTSLIIEPFFLSADYSAFIEGFRAFDIAKIILMCAAAHAQVPASTQGHIAELNVHFPANTSETNTPLSEVPIDLDHCSTEQYMALHQIANHYHLVGHIPGFVPINIKHIRISTLSQLSMFADKQHGARSISTSPEEEKQCLL